MAQILVRDLDIKIVERLKQRAQDEGRSLQSELKRILEQAAIEPRVGMESARALVETIRKKFKGRRFPDSATLVRAERDR